MDEEKIDMTANQLRRIYERNLAEMIKFQISLLRKNKPYVFKGLSELGLFVKDGDKTR